MYTPPGFATVTPYIFVESAEHFCHFLVAGLGGTEIGRALREDGKIANAQIRLGNCTIMVSEAGRGYPAMPASYYLYVPDAKAAMARAIAAGAQEIMPVQDMPYQDRQGGIRDAHGNFWWISQRLVPGGYHDAEESAAKPKAN
ncbi:VOC family protein [Pseudonocardia sp. TMWB2A]|uniref:VOC family protein n=1 Tax=Pseudonocardia sp. TMWB2A TaxID=687430 RepID=UPI00307E134A